MAGYYDPKKDYSLAIVNAQKRGATEEELNQLRQERQNKIDAQYGGTDPYKGTNDIMGNFGKTEPTVSNTNQNAGALLGGGVSGYESFQDFLDGMGYDDYTAQTQKYIQAAVQNAVKGYENQIDTVNRDTKELARQAYINNMLGQKNMDQQLAAAGMAGGMADSQRIAMQANYENSLNDLEMQRQETVKELQLAIENAKLTGDMQTAQELGNYLQQMQGQWASYMQNQQAMANENYWNQKTMENQNYWNQQAANTENQNAARNWALTMIQNGTMPDETTLTAAGMTGQQAQALLNSVKQQNAARNATVEEPVKYTEEQAATAVTALLAGSNDETARAIVESYFGMPVETVLQAYGQEVSGYDEVAAEIQQLKADGESSATINKVISAAVKNGQITSSEAMQLRSGFIGGANR